MIIIFKLKTILYSLLKYINTILTNAVSSKHYKRTYPQSSKEN